MTLEHSDPWLDIHLGDVRDVLPTLPADSVDCIVTSPPYWGLRDYGTAKWVGGNNSECDHLQSNYDRGVLTDASGRTDGGGASAATAEKRRTPYRYTCGKCGAVRQDSQLGLERTPEEYVANLVAVFRELRRVLKPAGTCWLNLGDSYARDSGTSPTVRHVDGRAKNFDPSGAGRPQASDYGMKPKDLVGIPWRVAFALQADGWYLRSDIIWSKPNPMPESVTDRPTKAHEYLFLLTKSARYYFDADAVRERSSWVAEDGTPLDSWGRPIKQHVTGNGEVRKLGDVKGVPRSMGANVTDGRRNVRSVWTIATRPYPGAHFAVFPPELPERCIKAGSSERGVCPDCGAPWERVVSVTGPDGAVVEKAAAQRHSEVNGKPLVGDNRIDLGVRAAWGGGFVSQRSAVGWRPTCDHDAAPVPAVVLDPFAGSGTTGLVANKLSRRAILVDLNGEYLKQQLKRNAQTPLGLA